MPLAVHITLKLDEKVSTVVARKMFTDIWVWLLGFSTVGSTGLPCALVGIP